jgi:hypothetical protein
MRFVVGLIMVLMVHAGTAAGEPWLDIFAVDGADSLRVEVGDLLAEDAALAIEGSEAGEAPRGSLTVIDAAGEGAVYPLVWDPLAGCLAAQFPATEPPFLVGAAVRLEGELVFVPATGLLEFPGGGD